jgi:triphosphoribosyl-dephospho-CoA synthetase
MSSHTHASSVPEPANIELRAGWEAALLELRHMAAHLEARGAFRGAVTLYDAIRIARAGGLRCEHQHHL